MGFALEKVGYSTELKTTTCCVCGTPFAIDAYLYGKLFENHNDFYCPNGHSQHFTGKTEAEKLREELARKEQAFSRELNQRLEAERQLNRLKKRVGNGTCPCCKRSFSNLHRHMKTKHPEFKNPETTKL